MQDLTVIGVEDGAVVVSSVDGARFRIAIDDALTSALRQPRPDDPSARKIAPREIQAHIRSGMSAEDVAAITGTSLEYIQKFERPVLAEREFIVESALNVPVHTAMDIDPMSEGSTFGSVIRDRLQDLGASGERWASWKEAEGGWIVKLAFTADEIDHDARWRYEPKKAALAPINNEAHALSQQGEMTGGLIPRLRAVGDDRPSDATRFDSGAFDVRTQIAEVDASATDISTRLDSAQYGRSTESSPEVSAAAIKRSPVEPAASHQTADLLDALRRRRGERESASWDDEAEAKVDHPSNGRIRLVDVPLDDFAELEGTESPAASTATANTSAGSQFSQQPKGSSRKGRAAMPTWDEIVFGARSDDDLA